MITDRENRRLKSETEAEDSALAGGDIVVAVRHPEHRSSSCAIGATTIREVGAKPCTIISQVAGGTLVIGIPKTTAPFPHIAGHIVQTKSIRGLTSNYSYRSSFVRRHAVHRNLLKGCRRALRGAGIIILSLVSTKKS